MNDPESNKLKIHPAAKVFVILVLAFVPIALVAAVFMPLIAGKHKQEIKEYPRLYSLRPDFTRADLSEAVDKMRQDYEFQYYFKILEKKSVALAVDQVYAQIPAKMDRQSFSVLLKAKQTEVERLGQMFDSVYFAKDDRSPDYDVKRQELKKALCPLFYKDFKLSVMGAIYKSTYDPSFQFQWPFATLRTAINMKTALNDMNRGDISSVNSIIQTESPFPAAPPSVVKNP